MGNDVFCAFCGVVALMPVDLDDLDDQLVTLQDMEWMGDVRVMGENPQSSSLRKSFISGKAQYDDWGFFDVEPGTDPNFPGGEESRRMLVYDSSGSEPFAIPFHTACFALFGKSIAPERVDIETLYGTLRSLSAGSEGSWLNIDYGAVKVLHGQYWSGADGAEKFVCSPVTIPWLAQYYKSLPVRTDSENQSLAISGIPLGSPSKSAHDPFSRLPVEILALVLHHTDIKSVYSWRQASRFAAQISLDDVFWKKRVWGDMLWLYDLPIDVSPEVSSVPVDWAKVYKDLFRASDMAYAERALGLVNRRRIWGLCNTISKVYMSKKPKASAGSNASRVLDGAKSTPLSLLVTPDPKDTTSTQVALLNDYQDLLHEEPVVAVSWTKDGCLGNIECSRLLGASTNVRQSFAVPRDDWITGVVITSECFQPEKDDEVQRRVIGIRVLFAKQDSISLGRADGDQRVIQVTGSQFLVGFTCQRTSSGRLAKLALLKQPKTKIPAAAKPRLVDRRAGDYNTQLAKYLWRGEIPPVPLHASGFEHGYWAYDLRLATSSMEALVLGSCEEELSDITAIGADVLFGGFEVQYGSRPPRVSGPRRQAMRYLHMDGKDGERVVSMYCSINHIPTSVRLVTNRGRQLVVGHPSSEKRYPSEEPKDQGFSLGGFHCYWSDRHLPKATLQGVGALYLPSQPTGTAGVVEASKDANEFHWAPEPPPRGIAESGRVWGEREVMDFRRRQEKKYPTAGTVVSWLDCRHALENVRVTFCHSTGDTQIPLAAITFSYAQSNEQATAECSTVGAEIFTLPSDTTGANGHHWCWCHYGTRREAELQTRPHHTHETWQVGSQRLRCLSIWLSEKGVLVGMQFIALDGSLSPPWGSCEDDPSGGIDFITGEVKAGRGGSGAGGPLAAGIKFYMGDNERHTSRDDDVIVAVQALVEDETETHA